MLWSSTLSVSLLLNHVVIGIQTLKLLLKTMEKDYENVESDALTMSLFFACCVLLKFRFRTR